MYWFQALDWGYATTDSTLAKTLYAKSCTDCSKFMQNFDEAKAREQHFRGDRVYVSKTEIVDDIQHADAEFAVDVTIDIDAGQQIDATGKTVAREAALHDRAYLVWMTWTGSRWWLIDFKEVQQ